MKNEEVIEKAMSILSKYSLCDSCLGRQFALLGSGLSNRERGKAIKIVIFMKSFSVTGTIDSETLRYLCESGFKPAITIVESRRLFECKAKSCYICGNILSEKSILEIVEKIEKKLEGLDFESFKVGCRVNPDVLEREENIRSYFKLEYGESIKSDINREIGKKLQKRLGKTYLLENPDVTIIVDFIKDIIELEIRPLCVYGRYRKLTRGIPQNVWYCPVCRGRGCDKCNNTGRLYQESIEEYIALPILSAANGSDYKFHGAGREDIDVLTLGNGRPFVVEIKNPRVRKINLEKIVNEINEKAGGKVEVLFLKYTDRKTIRRIKRLAEISAKTYRAVVTFEDKICTEKLKELEEFFKNRVVNQRTPKRVLHRRSDRLRKKTVFEVRAKKLNDNKVEFTIKCQGGLYVKELITGDEGRTNPSFYDFLKVKVRSIVLDVINIEDVTDLSFIKSNVA